MKRHLYALMAMVGVAAIVVAVMVTGAIAQTMGEYGAATASAGTRAAGTNQLDTQMPGLDTQTPGTVWAGATEFPDGNQLSGASQFPDTDRFSSTSTADSESSDRFSSADQFPQTSALDSSADRFDTGDRWSQDNWGK